MPQTHTHTHTHPKESDPKRSLLRSPARMERRAEDQNLPRTCPPRVVFALSRATQTYVAMRSAEPGASETPGIRAMQSAPDPAKDAHSSRLDVHLTDWTHTQQTGHTLDRLDTHSIDWTQACDAVSAKNQTEALRADGRKHSLLLPRFRARRPSSVACAYWSTVGNLLAFPGFGEREASSPRDSAHVRAYMHVGNGAGPG